MKTEMTLAAAVLAACVSLAQEEESSAPEGGADIPKAAEKPVSEIFSTLPFCREVFGRVEVLKPGVAEWIQVEDGRFYPLGSSYRAGEGGRAVIAFGKNAYVSMESGSSFETRVEALGGRSRTIVPLAGTLQLSLPDNLPDGAFFVTTAGFTVKNPAGSSKYVYSDKGDGFEASVRCVTGALEVEGRHFSIPKMRAANEFRVRNSHDNLMTILYGVSGDFVVKVDQGVATTTEINDDGSRAEKVGALTLDWHLTPETRVQIFRAVPSVGERMSVHTMAFDATGALQSERSFCEGRAEVNSGELVVKDKADSDELAKRAAEATEDAAAEETSESASGDGDSAGAGNSSSEDSF